MKLSKEAIEKLLYEIKHSPDYTMDDLLKISNALTVLQGYGLADLDLCLEVSKFIIQKGESTK